MAHTKLTDRSSDGINRIIVDARVVGVGFDAIERPNFDDHGLTFPREIRNGKGVGR
jgi:hypothetical protein